MEKQEKIVEIIYETYKQINFVDRYKTIYPKYRFDLGTIMSRMNKKENLNVMKDLGYKFKIFTPGQHYNYEEQFGDIRLILSCQISGGMVIPYIYIYIYDKKIGAKQNFRANIGFVYKRLTNDFKQIVNVLSFRNYEDLKGIMKSVIEIYEDFKKEFLKRMEESNLLKE